MNKPPSLWPPRLLTWRYQLDLQEWCASIFQTTGVWLQREAQCFLSLRMRYKPVIKSKWCLLIMCTGEVENLMTSCWGRIGEWTSIVWRRDNSLRVLAVTTSSMNQVLNFLNTDIQQACERAVTFPLITHKCLPSSSLPLPGQHWDWCYTYASLSLHSLHTHCTMRIRPLAKWRSPNPKSFLLLRLCWVERCPPFDSTGEEADRKQRAAEAGEGVWHAAEVASWTQPNDASMRCSVTRAVTSRLPETELSDISECVSLQYSLIIWRFHCVLHRLETSRTRRSEATPTYN